MKTNYFTKNRISIRLALAALSFFPFISKAQPGLHVTTSDNVGIGTTSPDIFGNGAAYRTLSVLGPNTSANSCGILELASKSTDADANIAGVLNFIASSNASTKQSVAQVVSFTQGTTATNRGGFLIFNTKPDGATSAIERMRIDNTGKIGIGTSTPSQKLDVTGSINASTSFMLGGSNTLFNLSNNIYGNIRVLQNNSTNTWQDGMYINYNSTGGTSAHLRFFANGTNEKMRIDAATGNVLIGTTTSGAYKLDVQGGDINASGSVRSAGVALTSDQQFKTNIDSLQSALAIIHQLKPKSYYFDTLNFNGEGKFNFSTEKQHGFVAQDVENVVPELVSVAVKPAIVDTLGNVIKPAYTYRALNYIGFISILTKGIQELQQKNDNLESKVNNQDSINTSLQTQVNDLLATNTLLQNQLNQLLATINNCCTLNETRLTPHPTNTPSQTLINQTNIELNDVQTIVLEQNVPNPFAEQTSINYSLPDNTVKAQMLFYNAQGKLIQSTELTQKGKGILNVFASDLSSGIYTYTLVVDGIIIETKKMVKQ